MSSLKAMSHQDKKIKDILSKLTSSEKSRLRSVLHAYYEIGYNMGADAAITNGIWKKNPEYYENIPYLDIESFAGYVKKKGQ